MLSSYAEVVTDLQRETARHQLKKAPKKATAEVKPQPATGSSNRVSSSTPVALIPVGLAWRLLRNGISSKQKKGGAGKKQQRARKSKRKQQHDEASQEMLIRIGQFSTTKCLWDKDGKHPSRATVVLAADLFARMLSRGLAPRQEGIPIQFSFRNAEFGQQAKVGDSAVNDSEPSDAPVTKKKKRASSAATSTGSNTVTSKTSAQEPVGAAWFSEDELKILHFCSHAAFTEVTKSGQ